MENTRQTENPQFLEAEQLWNEHFKSLNRKPQNLTHSQAAVEVALRNKFTKNMHNVFYAYLDDFSAFFMESKSDKLTNKSFDDIFNIKMNEGATLYN